MEIIFTRNNLIEAIIHVLINNPKEIYNINKLYEKVKKSLKYLPDENVFKFQYIVTIDSIKKNESLEHVIKKDNNLFTKEGYFTDDNLHNNLFTIDYTSSNFKKILIDIKNNKKIYDKLDRDSIFNRLIKY